jgi:hypothetical protein
MPAKWGDVKSWAEKQRGAIVTQGASSHCKISFPDGWVYTISAHNGLKSTVTDVYLRKIAKHFELTLDELLRQL